MNAIITAAAGYKPEDIEVFLNSAQRHAGGAKIYVMILHKDRQKFLRRFQGLRSVEWLCLPVKFTKGVKFYYQPVARLLAKREYPPRSIREERLVRFPLHIALERYFYAQDILRSQPERFAHILLCDSRDVVIQKDPFRGLVPSLVCGVEERTLSQCPFNADWINHIYGEAARQEMADWPIVCSGVTLGSAGAIADYLQKMCAEMWRHLPKLLRRGWYDQGVHNRLFFEHKLAYALTSNSEGIIATLGYEDRNNISIDRGKGCVCVRGVCPAIVHQYDRFPDLTDFYKQMFCERGE